MPSGPRTNPAKRVSAAKARRPAWFLRAIILGAAFGAAALSFLLVVPYLTSHKSTATPTAEAPSSPASTIEDVTCWFSTPAGHTARCGILRVPENRSAPQTHPIGLRFVILGRTTAATADPVVYISGGPGELAQLDAASIGFWWDWMDRERWFQNRDLVLFDQRGVGLSEPRMDCPELVNAAYKVLEEPLSLNASNAVWADAAGRCHARLVGSGIDLTSYNTTSIVADLKDLLRQLGYRSPILLASSYGTRVALRIAADTSVGIGAMVLDSVDPPEAREYVDGGTNAAAAFAGLFQSCAADLACHTAFPTLANDFDHIVAQAAVEPLLVTVSGPNHSLLTAQLDDAKLVETLFYAFYNSQHLQELPAIIAALARGDNRPLAPLIQLGLQDYDGGGASLGLFLSVECHDNFSFNPRADVERAAAATPLFRDFALSTLPLAACPAWPVGDASAAEHVPLTRDVPVLMLSGELDPATSPQWATEAAAHLPHAYIVKFLGVGHGVLGTQACASRLVDRFLTNSTRQPSDDCQLSLAAPHFRKVTTVEAK